ncbi:MAG: N-acetylglucosamine-6-phosphate deacetylase [Erysipelotrichaceae bacterium]|nr:N-acetylglucosamine-6-phosphate deacetylase [Erysipelotrichaceae bacterium]
MYLLEHGHLVIDGNREFLDGAILVDNGRIAEVYPQSSRVKDVPEGTEKIDLKGQVVMPGYFDTHTHGSVGISFDDTDIEGFEKVSDDFLRSGTTGFIASLSYALDGDGYIEKLKMLEDYESSHSRFMGIHLEGPFLSTKHIGVGDGKQFVGPDMELMERMLSASTKIRQMTIAYELEGAKEIGKLLKEKGIKVMCGHSDAVLEDLDDNVDGFTHLFNAMRPLHHRDITLVNCAFMNRWQCEVITDGHHIDRNVLKLILNNIDRDRIMIVTDSSMARSMPDGEYDFMSKKCFKKNGCFITDDGHFAGSTVSINDEIKVLYGLGAKYTDLLLYSSLNAFRFYGLDREYGTIEKGKHADLVFTDDDLNIQNVMIRGGFVHV